MSESYFKILSNLFARKIVKFFLVAFIATILNYLIFYFCLEFLGINYKLSSAIGFISGVFLGFQLNSKWTFKGNEKSKSKVFKYYVVYLFSLGVSLICLTIFVETNHLDARVANILCICITFCTNYIGTRFWVFKEKALVGN